MKDRGPWWNGPHIHRLLGVAVVAIHTVVVVGPKSSSSWWCSLPLLWVVVSQVDAPCCWFISFNRRCSSDISFRSLCKTEWWRACLLFRILFLFSFRSCSLILFRRSSDMIRYSLFPFLSLLGKNSIFNVFIVSKFKKYTRN